MFRNKYGSMTCNFYPRPPRGGRRFVTTRPFSSSIPFLSTPSARRATTEQLDAEYQTAFLSTPSARRATGRTGARAGGARHFYPRPPRGGRPA